MRFSVEKSIEVLSATPGTLRSLLAGLSNDWTGTLPSDADASAEGNRTPQSDTPNRAWDAFDVVGHLIHGEETDWIPRARIILEQGDDRTFVPFDRFAQFEKSRGRSLTDLLSEFERLRRANIDELHGWELTDAQLDLEGTHPELGRVTLRQLVATWVVHDLNHVRQIATAMAKKYDGEVGPWKEYLSILG